MVYRTTYPYINGVLATFDNATDEALEGTLVNGYTLYRKRCAEGSSDERKAQLYKIAELPRRDVDKYAEIMTKDMGKFFTEAEGEVELCTETVDYYADKAEELLKPCPLENISGNAYHIKQATGVLVAVEPWNFPFYQIMCVFAPNFMTGNLVILKHTSICPAPAQAFDDLALEAGAPVGAFKNLFLSYDQVPKAIANPRVIGVCLTGSGRGGASIVAETGADLKKSSTELGGNDAFIILEDADFDLLDKTVLFTRLYNAGQACISSECFVVAGQENHDKFVDMIVKHFKPVKWGSPMDQATTLASLSLVAAKKEVLGQIELAKENGATVVHDDEPTDHPGNFVMPTALTNTTKENPIYNQEIFSPVASIYKADTKEEAIAFVNDFSCGLSGTVFSKDLDHTKEAAAKIETGMSFINSGWTSHPEIPFEGIKNSDYGRELSELGFDAFVSEHPASAPND